MAIFRPLYESEKKAQSENIKIKKAQPLDDSEKKAQSENSKSKKAQRPKFERYQEDSSLDSQDSLDDNEKLHYNANM